MHHVGLTVLSQPETPPARPRVSQADSLDGAVAELCALQHYLVEILEVQQCEPEVRGVTPAANLVHRALAKFRRHTRELRDILTVNAKGGDDLRAAVASKCALFFRYLSKQRSRDLAGILRDDFTLFSTAAAQYRQLQAHAVAAGNAAVARLAEAHQTRLAPLLFHLALLNGAPRPRPARPGASLPPPRGSGAGSSSLPWPQAV